MNKFIEKFGKAIENFYGQPDEEQQALLADILAYANADPHSFKTELAEVQFDYFLMPLGVVLEALAKDTDNWGQFFVDLLNTIFTEAKRAEKPKQILSNLMEFFYIEEDTRPFVQKIVDRVYRELDSENTSIAIAAIFMLPDYFANPSIRNKDTMVLALQQKLNDPRWKVRCAAHESLGFDNMVPAGNKLSLKDRLLKLLHGDPIGY